MDFELIGMATLATLVLLYSWVFVVLRRRRTERAERARDAMISHDHFMYEVEATTAHLEEYHQQLSHLRQSEQKTQAAKIRHQHRDRLEGAGGNDGTISWDPDNASSMSDMFAGAVPLTHSSRPVARAPRPDRNVDIPEPAAPEVLDSHPDRREQKRRWAGVRERFLSLQIRMATYETDPALAIDYPAFNDVTVPEVKSMVASLRQATHLEDASDKDSPIGGGRQLLLDLEQAVLEFSLALDEAELAARKLRWSHLPAGDRKALEKIQGLLSHAMNPGNTDEARHSYYAQLQRSIRRLNEGHGAEIIPTGARLAIEDSARLAIGPA